MLATLDALRRKSSVLLAVLIIAAAFIAPPDVVSQLVLAAEMIIVYGIVFLIVRWFDSYKKAPDTSKRKVVVAVCLFSIFVGFCTVFIPRALKSRPEHSEQIPAADPPEAPAVAN